MVQRMSVCGRPDSVVGDDQIEQAVVVVVEPGAGHAQRIGRLAADARSRRHIGECPVSVVVVESVLSGAANEQIRITVVVVVAHGHAEVEVQVFARQSRVGRDIFESAVGALLQQAVVVGGSVFFNSGSWAPLVKKRSMRPSLSKSKRAMPPHMGFGKYLRLAGLLLLL
jgi:hypothetical protein